MDQLLAQLGPQSSTFSTHSPPSLSTWSSLSSLNQSPIPPDWSKAPPVNSPTPPRRFSKPNRITSYNALSAAQAVSVTEVDRINHPQLPDPATTPPIHALCTLQERLRAYLISTLPQVVERNLPRARLIRERQEHEERQISIHAKASRPPLIPIPDADESQNWTPRQCILWLDKVLPKEDKLGANVSVKLADLITPPGQRGGRKGTDWSRGDWLEAAGAVERYCGTEVGQELRTAVEQAISVTPQPMR